MNFSTATQLLRSMLTVTRYTITEDNIDVALLCHEPAISDYALRTQLVQAIDDLKIENVDSENVQKACQIVNRMVIAARRARDAEQS